MNEATEKNTNEIMSAKFFKGFHIKEPIKNLMLGISMGNEKQKGKYLTAFINMVNLNRKNIKNLEIIVGAYLHRHYTGEEEAKKMHEKWVNDSETILKSLTVPYKIIDWKDIVETEDFKKDQDFINQLYETDSGFRTKIESVEKRHIDKGAYAKEYLLEECAFFKGAKGYFTYPGKTLNVACVHIIEHYNPEFYYKPYVLLPPKKNLKNKTINTQVISIEKTVNNNKQADNQYTYPADVQPADKDRSHSSEIASSLNKVKNLYPVSIANPSNFNNSIPEDADVDQFINCCRSISQLMQKFGFNSVSKKEMFFSQFLRKEQEIVQLVKQTEDIYDTESTHRKVFT